MHKRKLGRTLMMPLALVMAITLAATAACTPSDIELLKGVLQNVDSANGKITIVTKDGKTVTLKIDTETEVDAEGTKTTAGNLEPGASVEVKVKKDEQTARQVKARQAEVEGKIIKVDGNKVTIETERGRQITLQVTDRTRIELEDDQPGSLTDIQVGAEVEAKFDPTNNLAFKIELEEEEEEKKTSRVGWGILEIRVTDPPPADVKSAVVYLSNIEVHKVSDNASESDNDSGNWIPVIGAPTSFDLMDVIGVEQVLGAANITAGKFTQIRMDVTKVSGVTTDNISYTAEVPSDKLRIVGAFNVGGGTKTTLTLDFDGEKSLIRTGQGKFLFKPVVKLLVKSGRETAEEKGRETGKPSETGKPATAGNATDKGEGKGKKP